MRHWRPERSGQQQTPFRALNTERPLWRAFICSGNAEITKWEHSLHENWKAFKFLFYPLFLCILLIWYGEIFWVYNLTCYALWGSSCISTILENTIIVWIEVLHLQCLKYKSSYCGIHSQVFDTLPILLVVIFSLTYPPRPNILFRIVATTPRLWLWTLAAIF